MADSQEKIVLKGEDQYSKTFRNAEKGLTGVEKTANRAGEALKRMFAPLAAGAILYKLQQFAGSALEAGDQIAKMSTRLGASTEALSEYRLVASKASIDFSTLTMGWQRMTRRISEAAQGTGEAKDALRELGLDAQKLNAVAPDQQFEALADALMRVEGPADRVRLAMKLFDSEGVALIQTMGGGAAGIREVREEAVKAGMSMSGEAAKGAEEYANAVAELRGGFSGLAETIVLDAAPALTQIVDAMSESRDKTQDFFQRIGNESSRWKKLAILLGLDSESRARLKQELEDWGREVQGVVNSKVMAGGPLLPLGDGQQMLGPFEREADSAADAMFRLNEQLAATPAVVEAAFEEQIPGLLEFGDYLHELYLASEEVLGSINGAQGVAASVGGVGEAAGDMDRTLASAADSAGYSIANSIGGALADTKRQLIDLGSVGRSVFGSLLGGLISWGVFAGASALFPGSGFLKFLSGARADGGPVMAGGAYLVGEQGPELFVPSQSGTVVANGASAGMNIGTLQVSVAGTVSDDPMSVRRLATRLKRELDRLATHQGATT